MRPPSSLLDKGEEKNKSMELPAADAQAPDARLASKRLNFPSICVSTHKLFPFNH
jgi:L-ribulose-5-phosphate 3-epimerase UlaE